MKKYILLLLIITVSIPFAEGQSAKKLLRIGNKQLKENMIEEAELSYTNSIRLNPELSDAYFKRAEVYLRLGKTDSAIEDLNVVNQLDPKEEEAWLKNGHLNYQKEDYTTAAEKYSGYLNLKPKDLFIYDRVIECLEVIDNYQQALVFAKKKLAVKDTPETQFEIGNIQFVLGNYKAAESNYRKALKEVPTNVDYRNGLALALYHENRSDASIVETNKVLREDKNNKRAYLTRAMAYHKKIEYTSAINDMSKVIVLYPNDDDIVDNLNYRGDLYLEFSQHMNAISDYTKAINKEPENTYSLSKRAQAYEATINNEAAIADLAKIMAIAGAGTVVSENIVSDSKTRLYNLRRESNAPVVTLKNENASDYNLRVTFDTKEFNIKARINDDNTIAGVSIDGKTINIPKNTGEIDIEHIVSLTNKETILIEATDVYGNKSKTDIIIQRVENDAPIVNFMLPYTNESNEMILDTDDSRVYFEGNVKDESLIKSIMIDGVLIPFKRDELNPVFTSVLDLQGKTKIVVSITDIYDNVMETEYYLNREESLYAADSPMGKTWVVFLENSDYTSFASLDGPIKDIRLMKTALANYEVHNIIHRKNLTKQQMERFFSIELRDMVKNNHVNSLVVWYAGHGKYQNETGYWIPVDADRGDEFSFFNINNLKASIQVYAGDITHTLIITDACESGPSFYQAMRNDIEVRSCGDEDAVKFKSSQVLSSAGYELATDNSQFTKTFANSLMNNSDVCIPIESIVLKVGDAVTKDNQQKPQFGKIAGLEDENGTFFFIKRGAKKTNQ